MSVYKLITILLLSCSVARADVESALAKEIKSILSGKVTKIHLALNPHAELPLKNLLDPIRNYTTYENEKVNALLTPIADSVQWRQGLTLIENGTYYVFFENDKGEIVLALQNQVSYGHSEYFLILKAEFSENRTIVLKGCYPNTVYVKKNGLLSGKPKLIYLKGFAQSDLFKSFMKGKTIQIPPRK